MASSTFTENKIYSDKGYEMGQIESQFDLNHTLCFNSFSSIQDSI